MKKKHISVTIFAAIMAISSCGNSSVATEPPNTVIGSEPIQYDSIEKPQNEQISDLEDKINEIQNENERLLSENNKLAEENRKLNDMIKNYEEKEKKTKEESTVQQSDVDVKLTGKKSTYDEYDSPYISLIFSVKNNTEKTIKGVQGVATFNDLFGVKIISINCDFTGNTISPGETITVSDLYFDCNRFMDDHMKLFNTKIDDIKFEYKVKTIVFTDGTTKSV